jgi:hypothetical protein
MKDMRYYAATKYNHNAYFKNIGAGKYQPTAIIETVNERWERIAIAKQALLSISNPKIETTTEKKKNETKQKVCLIANRLKK